MRTTPAEKPLEKDSLTAVDADGKIVGYSIYTWLSGYWESRIRMLDGSIQEDRHSSIGEAAEWLSSRNEGGNVLNDQAQESKRRSRYIREARKYDPRRGSDGKLLREASA